MPEQTLARQQTAVDFFSGSPGKLLAANGFDLACLRPVIRDNGPLRANDLLRKDEWKALDDTVVEVAKRQLNAIADLRAAGLVRNLGSLGVMFDEYEAISYIDEAEQSMTGVADGQRDLATYGLVSVPIPITFRDFQLHLRHLEASRRGGSNIDTSNVSLCTQRVLEKLEDMLFNGSTVAPSGTAVAGYTTASSRITGSVTAAWASATGAQILADALAMISDAEDENYFGPFQFYTNISAIQNLRNDFKTNSDKTIIERLEQIDAFAGIKGNASLTAETVAVQLTSDVVDLSVGADITTVQWEEMGGLIQNFKVMAAMAPRVKVPRSTNAKTGLVHYS